MKSTEPTQRMSTPVLCLHNPTALPRKGPLPPQAQTVPGTRAPTFLHRPERQRARTLWPYPSRAMLGILLLLGVLVAAACWNARPGPANDVELQEIDLRAAAVSPKVNSTSAELPTLPATQPEPELPKVELPQLPPPPQQNLQAAPEFPAPPPSEVKLPQLPPQAIEETQTLVPVVFYGPGSLACSCFHDPLQGDSPMMRNWNVLQLSSVMAVAMAVAPLPAAAPKGPPEPGQTEIDKLTDSVNKLKKACDEQKETIDKQKETLTTLNSKLDKLIDNLTKGFDGVNVDLNKIKGDVKTLTDDSTDTKLRLQSALGRIQTLEDQMAALKSEMGKLVKRDPALYPPDKAGLDEIKARLEKIEAALARLADARTSFAGPPNNVGKIQLANFYPEEMLFVINGKPYRVAPNTTMDIPGQPAGVFSYEVISGTYGLRARNTPMLEAGKTYTITVR